MADASGTHAGETPWTRRAADWAEVMEGKDGWGVPVYRHILESVGLGEGSSVLDVGCGAGRFCRLVAERGFHVSGLDATAAFIDIARERVPSAAFTVGTMEALPYPDESFDLVTGFNSFFIADDMAGALREAARVARPGAAIATTVFGRPDRCDSTSLFGAVRALMPESPVATGASSGPRLHEEGTLESIAETAGLTVREAGWFGFTEGYRDVQTLARGMMAAPPMIRAGQAVGDDAVREAVVEAAAPFAGEDGRVQIQEEVRYLIARA
jgi:SAM-dependent methyltransferase